VWCHGRNRRNWAPRFAWCSRGLARDVGAGGARNQTKLDASDGTPGTPARAGKFRHTQSIQDRMLYGAVLTQCWKARGRVDSLIQTATACHAILTASITSWRKM